MILRLEVGLIVEAKLNKIKKNLHDMEENLVNNGYMNGTFAKSLSNVDKELENIRSLLEYDEKDQLINGN